MVLSFFHGTMKANELFQILFDGYQSKTGVESIDSLLTRGGVNSMMFTISLVILSLSLGGLLFKLGIIPALLQKRLRSFNLKEERFYPLLYQRLVSIL